jgi:hypothetical protein
MSFVHLIVVLNVILCTNYKLLDTDIKTKMGIS